MLKRADLAARRVGFRVARRLGRSLNLVDLAEKAWEVAPSAMLHMPPSVCLPGEFEKARDIAFWTTWEVETRRVRGGPVALPPVNAFMVRDAILHRGSVYKGRGELLIVPQGEVEVLRRSVEPYESSEYPVVDIAEGAITGSPLGMLFFGHWLCDDAPLALLASEYGEAVSPTPPNIHRSAMSEDQIAAYARLLELPWRCEENVRFKQVVFFQDEEYTAHKGARLEHLRERLKARLGAAVRRKRVFVRRGVADRGPRKFVNEEAVIEALAREGFDVITPSEMTVEEITAALHGVELVVGVEGSQIAHSLLCLPRGGGLLLIMPPFRFGTGIKRRTDAIGVHYGFIVGDPQEEGFTVDAASLLRTIELVEAASTAGGVRG